MKHVVDVLNLWQRSVASILDILWQTVTGLSLTSLQRYQLLRLKITKRKERSRGRRRNIFNIVVVVVVVVVG